MSETNRTMGKMKTSFVGETNDKNEKKHDKAHKADADKVHVAGLKGGQRVKIVEAAPTEEAPIIAEGTEGTVPAKKEFTKKIVEKVRGKKYVASKAKIDREKLYKIEDAIKLVKEASFSKFVGTMELHLVLKKVGASASLTLPHTAGREKKVEIASDETIEKLIRQFQRTRICIVPRTHIVFLLGKVVIPDEHQMKDIND